MIATPAEIDAELFPLWAAKWQAAEWLYNLNKYDDEKTQAGHAAWLEKHGTEHPNARSTRETRERYQAKIEAANEAMVPLNAFYDADPWTRYVLVGGGHLHYRNCSTLRPTTRMYLLAESSGLTADEVVARYTYTACTKCFPEAPVAD